MSSIGGRVNVARQITRHAVVAAVIEEGWAA